MSTWVSLRLFLNRRQAPDLRCDFAASADQVGDEPLVHVEGTFALGPISLVPERRQTQCVSGGAVSKVESAVWRVRFVLRVLEPCEGRTNETCRLLRIRRFICENVSRTREALNRRRGRSLRIPSPIVTA